MTDEDLKQSAGALIDALETIAVTKGASADDLLVLAGFVTLELLARHLGPIGAINRLRDIADVAERGILASVAN